MAGRSRRFPGETRPAGFRKHSAKDWKNHSSQPGQPGGQKRMGLRRQQTTAGTGHLEINWGEAMDEPILQIDGSMGEGGGQILRSALSLSLITGRGFLIEKIRANRNSPGLQRQHLAAVEAA